MTADPRDLMALNAFTRFGLGPRPGDLKRVASDPRGAVEAELMKRDVALLPDPYLESSRRIARSFGERRISRRLREGNELTRRQEALAEVMLAEGRLSPEALKTVRASQDAGMDGAGMDGGTDGPGMDARDRKAAGRGTRGAPKGGGMAGLPAAPRSPRDDETDARVVRARACDIGFVERWVWFWGNHFTVSLRSSTYVGWIAGAYEREAIRPHALGRFHDLLLAATKHPAMLNYLDLNVSRGPNSRRGVNRGRGFNENHARELLELHTVGVDGGYSQKDVTSLAYALTGWRTRGDPRSEDYGGYVYDAGAHEPGAQTVMGKTYADDGERQGEAILADLAAKPETARHVARRLAVAFVSDDPPPTLVARLEKSFRDTDGDLKQLARALVASDEAWSAPRTKMRSAQEFVFASARALDKPDTQLLSRGLKALGQEMWAAPSPKGFSIYGRDWLAPDAQTNRLDFSVEAAQLQGPDSDPNGLALELLGDVMSDETKAAVKRAGSREQAIALLLMSPEMQRR